MEILQNYIIKISLCIRFTVSLYKILFSSLESANNGEVRPQMTPRRVKRRSYTRSSARSAGKALKKEMHRQSGRSVRSASGALGTSGRPGKAINPVTRLMQETEPHSLNVNDSSTSNDDPSKQNNIERYGQVNPGFVTSRYDFT